MRSIKSIGVFCGSSAGSNKAYADHAYRLGCDMAKRNIKLIYGGGNIGLMGVIANAVLEQGGFVEGVIPKHLTGRELTHPDAHKMHIVDNMAARKELLCKLSDAFIALPGGLGTLDELFEMLTGFQLEINNKPCIIINTLGYYNHLISLLDHITKEKFMRPEHRTNVIVSDSPDNVIELLEQFVPSNPGKNWIEELKSKNTY